LAIDDVGLVGQSIQKRCGHDRITKDLCLIFYSSKKIV
jgi:hypothetical protein